MLFCWLRSCLCTVVDKLRGKYRQLSMIVARFSSLQLSNSACSQSFFFSSWWASHCYVPTLPLDHLVGCYHHWIIDWIFDPVSPRTTVRFVRWNYSARPGPHGWAQVRVIGWLFQKCTQLPENGRFNHVQSIIIIVYYSYITLYNNYSYIFNIINNNYSYITLYNNYSYIMLYI